MAQGEAAAFREWVQLITLVIGVVGGVFAVIKGLYEMGQSTQQRKTAELRWKRGGCPR